MKRVISVVVILIFFGASAPPSCIGKDRTFTKAIQEAKRFAVPIVCFGKDPDTKAPYLISVEGTGFFVSGDPRVLTAGHVGRGIINKGRIPACPIAAIYLPIDGWDNSNLNVKIRYLPIQDCFVGASLDIAVCSLAQDPANDIEVRVKPKAGELDGKIYPDGTPVAFVGFPLSFIQPIASQGIIGTYRNPVLNFGPTEIVIDKNAWPGASGSPVINSTAGVAGMIVQRGFNDASGLAFAIPSAVIKKFLADNPPAKNESK